MSAWTRPIGSSSSSWRSSTPSFGRPRDLEGLFREGVLTAGPPYTIRLQIPDAVVLLLEQDAEADAFESLLTDLRQRVRSVRTITTGELREHLLLALARVAAKMTSAVSVEQLAQLVADGEPVVSLCEMDGVEWLGPPAKLAPGVVLGRVSDALEQALSAEVGAPGFSLVGDSFHPITEDFQCDRVEPPEPGDDPGHYPVVLSLTTGERSVANNMIALQRLAAALGGALWLFSAERESGLSRPGIRDYAVELDRGYDSQLDVLVWRGGRWDNHPEDEYRQTFAAERALHGPAGKVFALAARAVMEPRNVLAERVLAGLRAAASSCDQDDPYDRLLLLVVALEALIIKGKTEPQQAAFVDQLWRLTDRVFDPKDLKDLYATRSALAHTGVLDDKLEAKLLMLTRSIAVPCLSAALVKLAQLYDAGVTSAANLLSWHNASST